MNNIEARCVKCKVYHDGITEELCGKCEVTNNPWFRNYVNAEVGTRFQNQRNGLVIMKIPDMGDHYSDLLVELESGKVFGFSFYEDELFVEIKK